MEPFDWADSARAALAFAAPMAALFLGLWSVFRFGFKTLSDKIDTGLNTLNDKIDANTKTLNDKIDTGLNTLNDKIDANTSSIEYLGRQVAGVKERLAHLEGKIGVPTPDPEQA